MLLRIQVPTQPSGELLEGIVRSAVMEVDDAEVVVEVNNKDGHPSSRKGCDERSNSVEFQDRCAQPEGEPHEFAVDPAFQLGVINGDNVEGLVLQSDPSCRKALHISCVEEAIDTRLSAVGQGVNRVSCIRRLLFLRL